VGIDEEKLGAGIDHATDQPAARRTVNLDSAASDPPAALYIVRGLSGLPFTRDSLQTLFYCFHGCKYLILSRRSEEIDGAHFAMPFSQLSQRNVYV